MDHARQALARIEGHLAQYQTLVRNLGLGDNASANDLAHHQAPSPGGDGAHRRTPGRAAGQAEHAIAQAHNAHTRLRETQAEYDAVRQRPGSNLPMEFQRFRAELAEHLGLARNRPALCCRAGGSAPGRTSVARRHRARTGQPPPAHFGAAGSNAHRTAMGEPAAQPLHVRLLEVRDATPAAFMPDGFARKLNLKPATPAAHLNTLRHLLHGLDRHCVPDVQTLERTPHAMTAQGLMSSQSGHFDKQDQKAAGPGLDDGV